MSNQFVISLDDLKEIILPGLKQLDSETQKKVIEIAQVNDPMNTFDLTEVVLLSCGLAPSDARRIARCASWLAAARRDKKEEQGFQRIVAKLAE